MSEFKGSSLQEKPKLFGVGEKVLILYLVQFVVFFALPYLLLSLSYWYYLITAPALVVINMVFQRQLQNISSLIVYYTSKKRIKT